ncbi:hypothetical protein PRIPAC_94794 [Pristionchus pacificus]|uniref:Uncharacterized protein n=1 Tax=Pristionchus pacificus TaxID=54126 RepID=A0A454Y0I7_PRIPA|nr:hypothetical protein PRIPAC_94794 [Pristionchus pacificus]|eukprot:PDM67925.1 hypothetical protein PRIPAC_45969 [Pristionchus pacificus]
MLRKMCLLMIIAVALCSSFPWSTARHRSRPRPAFMAPAIPSKREAPVIFTQTIPLSPAPIHGFSSRSSLPIELFVPPFVAYEDGREEPRIFRGFPMML